MLKANEARTILNQAMEQEAIQNRKNAEIFCEELSEKIEKRAKEQFASIEIEIPDNIKRSYVDAILKDHGYNVEININHFVIRW